MYELVAACPECRVDLLSEVPASTDPTTWVTQSVPGYEPGYTKLQAWSAGGSNNGLFFSARTMMTPPQGQSYFVVAVGISVGAQCIGVVILVDPVIVAGSTPTPVWVEGQLTPVLA